MTLTRQATTTPTVFVVHLDMTHRPRRSNPRYDPIPAPAAAHACKALLLLSKDNNEEDDHGGDDGDDENKTRTKKKKEEDEGSGVHYAAKFSRDSARTRQCGSS
jgi:hypothetical protein